MPYALEKPEGMIRVLVMGDSFTYGDGVFAEDTYPQILGTMVPEHVQVIVLAQNGNSTLDELTQFNLYGRSLEPDIVIVGLVTNDPDAGIIPQLELVNTPILTPIFSRSQFAYYIDVNNIIAEALPFLSNGQVVQNDWEASLYSDPENQRLWRQTVQEFYDVIKETGGEAWAYMLVAPEQDQEGNRAKFTTLLETFSDAGFWTRDISPIVFSELPYDPNDPNRYRAFPNDSHPNPLVHRLFAELIWEDLSIAIDDY